MGAVELIREQDIGGGWKVRGTPCLGQGAKAGHSGHKLVPADLAVSTLSVSLELLCGSIASHLSSPPGLCFLLEMASQVVVLIPASR